MTKSTTEDTIAAIATPPGPGGIGIIKISGPLALNILNKLFSRRPRADGHGVSSSFNSHQLYYGWLTSPGQETVIDEVLAVYMRGPHTYTREDVVEIHCHGSYVVLQEALGHVLAAGARAAEPGEFTKRAFLSGRIDLTQAEAVLELLLAKTSSSLSLATSQLQGSLHDRINAIRQSLVSMRAIIEVAIDFPEDDVEIIDGPELLNKLHNDVQAPLTEMLTRADQGKILREGISVVILGRPNVGKSSLLNTLLQEDRAIVTPIPGTTRDTIEEHLNIKGLPVRIIDTAGIRKKAGESVEEIGIERARAKVLEADLILLLLDATEPPGEEDRHLYDTFSASRKDSKLIIVLNKKDLAPAIDIDLYRNTFGNVPLLAISAKHHEGIRELEEAIFEIITGGCQHWDPGASAAPNLRHKDAILKALHACRQIETGLSTSLPPDLLAIDLQAALDHLGDIVGETTTEDILDMIFEQFCIGK